MSTRAAVMLIDGFGDTTRFYRHSDGYPDGVKESLDKLCEWLQKGYIRADSVQGSGWLLMIGAAEYGVRMQFQTEKVGRTSRFGKLDTLKHPAEQGEGNAMNWKGGAYEPLGDTPFPEDIEHLYVVDMLAGRWDEAPMEWAEKFNEKIIDEEQDASQKKVGDIVKVTSDRGQYLAHFKSLSDKFGFKVKVRPVVGGAVRTVDREKVNAHSLIENGITA